jgi:hypothetical protein
VLGKVIVIAESLTDSTTHATESIVTDVTEPKSEPEIVTFEPGAPETVPDTSGPE